MSALVVEPAFLKTWLLLLGIWGICAVPLLRTEVGRQALVDERVRVVEAFGGTVDDRAYSDLQAAPPLSSYLTSGGRLLLNPTVTLGTGMGLLPIVRRRRPGASLALTLSIAVHATTVLVLQQLIATPLVYVRESLDSTTSLAALIPVADEGTLLARVLGAVDVFGLWWVCLLSVGVGVATGQAASRWAVRFVGAYGVVAALMAIATMAAGGL
jgi:hypothetical protein